MSTGSPAAVGYYGCPAWPLAASSILVAAKATRPACWNHAAVGAGAAGCAAAGAAVDAAADAVAAVVAAISAISVKTPKLVLVICHQCCCCCFKQTSHLGPQTHHQAFASFCGRKRLCVALVLPVVVL